MKLIVENNTENARIFSEISESGQKSLFIEGIFAQAEKKNRNKRIYPKAVLESAIGRYNEDYVLKNRALGELNHPQSPVVNPERACILIKSLDWDGNDVYGKAKVLSTALGPTVAGLINDGVQLGVSTRGVGSLTEKAGDTFVEADYLINAIDVVWNPSGIDCWVDGILENVDFYIQNGQITEMTAEEYLRHRKFGNMDSIREDFNKFLGNIVI